MMTAVKPVRRAKWETLYLQERHQREAIEAEFEGAVVVFRQALVRRNQALEKLDPAHAAIAKALGVVDETPRV